MADDVKPDGARQGRPAESEPRRLRWSVPAVDVSTNYWLDKQENISRSLQLLIRESIQRDGYLDVVNRPVDQLPRRGRPPVESTEHNNGPSSADEESAAATETFNEHARPDSTQETETTLPAAEQPAGSEDETPHRSGESADDVQVDINDIMAGLRN
ncbi:hypothetical protein [Arthrobacter castelli]|uniref:hypothetical protein n=1 Tax=Arthrobacter castelli TaxID=271431 RepID=UPI0003F848F8|nr:hypothetical protein [Arthrobacter castelli]